MKIEFNTLYWDNTPDIQIESHKKVMEHFEIPVNYHCQNARHGRWMDTVCAESDSDIIGFFDSDCVPIDREKVMECIRYVGENGTFIGTAQSSNHIKPFSHIFASPAFFLIHKDCWKQLIATFSETGRSDVAEELSYSAEDKGIKYRCLYPTTFEREPVEGVWPLGNYGYYGIGTTFEDTVYHLYQGRLANNMDLFVKRCDEIANGTFSNADHIQSKTLTYNGRICR